MIRATDFWSNMPGGDATDSDTKPPLTPCGGLHLCEPRRVFAERLGHIEKLAGLRIPGRGALAALLTSYLADLSAAMPALTPVEAETGIDGVLYLYAALVRAPVLSDAAAEAREVGELSSSGLLALADSCIEASLEKPELDAAVLARTLGVSRSRLYKAFAPRGGVSAAIRDARLDRAHLQFTSSGGRHQTSAEVAYTCGFANYSSFTRAFRRRFGISPRDAKHAEDARHGARAADAGAGRGADGAVRE